MARVAWLVSCLLTALLTGCTSASSTPPSTNLVVAGEAHQTAPASYCWKSTCVDTVGGEELLQIRGVDHVPVALGERVSLKFDGQIPVGVNLLQSTSVGERSVIVDELAFNAPKERGTHYYHLDLSFPDGSATYVFALDVT